VKAALAQVESDSTRRQVLASASAVFSWAVREEFGGVKTNPCSRVERTETRSRDRVLSESELPQFLAAFEEADVAGMPLRMILLAGQRPGEVPHMRTEHVAGGWWTMPGAPDPALRWPGTKNGQTHRVWLPAPAQALLAEMHADGLVFPGARGGPV